MTAAARTLRASFADAEAFEREYQANLVNGGIFVAGGDSFALRERVRVELVFEPSDTSITLEGEVVHVLTKEMAQMGAEPGAAVQFDGGLPAVRGRLEALREAAGVEQRRYQQPGTQRAPRTIARVAAEIEADDRAVAGVTRNLSQTGVLVAVAGDDLPLGSTVRLTLRHPRTGAAMGVDGVVVRREENGGGVDAVALEFAPSDAEASNVADFVSSIQASEHTRRLGGIVGDIAELGIQNVMQMFAATGREGTLTFRNDEKEGVIGFEQGKLCFCRLGAVAGMKALVRLLGWEAGTFEYHSRLDEVRRGGEPLPFEGALLEASRLIDEQQLWVSADLVGDAVPQLTGEPADEQLSKTEAAVVDLVRAGFSVERMIAVIPDPDPLVLRALGSLREQGVISL